MNSQALRAVEHVARLAQIGVDSLKIEGRTKSLYYVARTAQVYRRAIDDAVAGRPFNPELLIELEGLSNRGYTGGLLGWERPLLSLVALTRPSSQGRKPNARTHPLRQLTAVSRPLSHISDVTLRRVRRRLVCLRSIPLLQYQRGSLAAGRPTPDC